MQNPAENYLLKVNNRNTRTRCEICSKLTIKTLERRSTLLASFWCLYCQLWTYFTPSSSVFIVNFEQANFSWGEIPQKFLWMLATESKKLVDQFRSKKVADRSLVIAIPIVIYSFKVNNGNNRTKYEICSKLVKKTKHQICSSNYTSKILPHFCMKFLEHLSFKLSGKVHFSVNFLQENCSLKWICLYSCFLKCKIFRTIFLKIIYF